MAKKGSKQAWKPGDVFAVELKDGTFATGQIVGQEKDVLNSVSCAFFDLRSQAAETPEQLPLDRVFSVLFVTRDLLDDGVWKVLGDRPVELDRSLLPYESLRAAGFVGAKIRGTQIVEDFLNAFYALAPWDAYKDPAYMDKLLLSPDKKPAELLYKGT